MKPFDLEAAKRGEPIVTRDGAHVKLVAHVPEAMEEHRVVVLCGGEIISYCENGCIWSNEQSLSDLFMAPKTRTVWVNFYNDPCYDAIRASVHATENDANQSAGQFERRRLGLHAYPVEIDDE